MQVFSYSFTTALPLMSNLQETGIVTRNSLSAYEIVFFSVK